MAFIQRLHGDEAVNRVLHSAMAAVLMAQLTSRLLVGSIGAWCLVYSSCRCRCGAVLHADSIWRRPTRYFELGVCVAGFVTSNDPLDVTLRLLRTAACEAAVRLYAAAMQLVTSDPPFTWHRGLCVGINHHGVRVGPCATCVQSAGSAACDGGACRSCPAPLLYGR